MTMKVKMLAIILAIATMFGVTVPAMAETVSENKLVNSSESGLGKDFDQAVNSITIPLTFDGSNPDSSQVVVERAQDTSTKDVRLFSTASNPGTNTTDDGLPKKVVETVSTTDSAITIVTADRYFLYTPEDNIQQCPFAVEFEGLPTDDYFVTLESESTTQSSIEYRKIYKIGNTYCYSDDIKSIISDVTSPAAIYLSVWQEGDNGTKTKLFGPTAVAVNYVENNVVTVPGYYKYLSSDSNSFIMALDIPGNVGLASNYGTLSLINSAGKVVAKNMPGNTYFDSNYEDENTDYRYKGVFSYEDILPTNYCRVSTELYRAANIEPGMYGLKLTTSDTSISKGTETTYPNMVKVVDGPLIKQIYNSSTSFAPPVYGGNEAYAFVTMEGAGKDDFTVSILDEHGNVIGSNKESKYIVDTPDTVAYKLLLNNNLKFEQGKNYFIKLNIKEGTMYYAGSSAGIHITNDFEVYDYSFYDDNTVADFNFKAVNIPVDTTTQIELGLFALKQFKVVSTVKVTPAAEMAHVQFKDADGKVISLIGGNIYRIKIKGTDGSWKDVAESFYVRRDTIPSNRKSRISMWGKWYFYTNDTAFDFNIGLRKDLNKITDSSKYVVTLKNRNGETVANVIREMEEKDITIDYAGDNGEKDVPAVGLSGKLALPVSGLKEGSYYLDIEITGVDNIGLRISALSPDKVYASYSYFDLINSGSGYKINSSAYMLKKDQSYDVSKFKYEMTDLLGNPIQVETVATYVASYSDEDFFEIYVSVPNGTPPAHYSLKLKYNGSDIFDYNNPSEFLISGYDAIVNIPARSYFDGYLTDGGRACKGINVLGKMTESDIITAVIYNSNNKEDFTPVKTLTLSKEENTATYLFPNSKSDLSGIDGNKTYDIIFLLNDKYLGELESVKIAGADKTVFAKGITLNTTSAAITVGNTMTLVAVVTPDNAANVGNIAWTTSNANVATVSNGVVTAKSVGTATITAKVDDKSATCYVVVNAASNQGNTTGGGSGGNSGGSNSGTTVVTPKPVSTSTTETSPVMNADSSGMAVVKAEQLQKAESLTIKGEVELTFDKAATEALKGLKGDIAITIKKADAEIPAEMKNMVGDRPVYDFTVTAGGNTISDFKGGSVKIEVPYIAKDDEDVNAIVIYYIDAQGKFNIVNNCIYNPTTKKITFTTTHFSKYAVGYNKVEYADVSGWATNAVTYLSARGIISGVGDNKYAPSNNITRADFAVILAKLAGADLSKYTSSRFEDVKASDRYAKAIEWAADNGIVSGVEKDKYAPKALITRQEMAVMITRLAKVMKHTLSTTIEQTDFADQKAISPYAIEAAKEVQMAGIISGKVKGENKEYFFAPKDYATRAEAAQMIYVLIKGMVK